MLEDHGPPEPHPGHHLQLMPDFLSVVIPDPVEEL